MFSSGVYLQDSLIVNIKINCLLEDIVQQGVVSNC